MFVYVLGAAVISIATAVFMSVRSHAKMVQKYGAGVLEQIREIRKSGAPLPW